MATLIADQLHRQCIIIIITTTNRLYQYQSPFPASPRSDIPAATAPSTTHPSTRSSDPLPPPTTTTEGLDLPLAVVRHRSLHSLDLLLMQKDLVVKLIRKGDTTMAAAT